MNHKQKIGYTLLGAFIMLIGMSIDNLTSSPVTAQSNGELTCQKLTFVDDTGKPLFYLEAEDSDRLSIFKADVYNPKTEVFENKEMMRLTCVGLLGNELSILNLEGREGVRLEAFKSGNFVDIFNHEGKGAVSLASENDRKSGADRNSVDIFNNEGEEAVSLAAQMKNAAFYAEASPAERELISAFEGNGVYVYNNAATLYNFGDSTTHRRFMPAFSLVSGKSGNNLSVYNRAGNYSLKTDPSTVIFPKAVSLGDTKYGGRVDVFNKQGKNRAVMSVNEYGNGAVSTWDKNGYRQ